MLAALSKIEFRTGQTCSRLRAESGKSSPFVDSPY